MSQLPPNRFAPVPGTPPDQRGSDGPEWVRTLRLRSWLLYGLSLGGLFGLGVAMALWPGVPGCTSSPPGAAEAASGVLLTSVAFGAVFGLLGLGIGWLVRLLGRSVTEGRRGTHE